MNKEALMGISTEVTNHKIKVKKTASDNVEHEDDSNKQNSGGRSEIRGDDDIAGIVHKEKDKKGKCQKGKSTNIVPGRDDDKFWFLN
jgi:hypothetical protein